MPARSHVGGASLAANLHGRQRSSVFHRRRRRRRFKILAERRFDKGVISCRVAQSIERRPYIPGNGRRSKYLYANAYASVRTSKTRLLDPSCIVRKNKFPLLPPLARARAPVRTRARVLYPLHRGGSLSTTSSSRPVEEGSKSRRRRPRAARESPTPRTGSRRAYPPQA